MARGLILRWPNTNKIGLKEFLGISDSKELFESRSDLADMTSLLKMPVYKNSKNYSGAPCPLKKDNLKKLIESYFLEDLKSFKNKPLLIPFGKAVNQVFHELNIANDFSVLSNFPHPSGGNGHRQRVFNANKKKYFKSLKVIKQE